VLNAQTYAWWENQRLYACNDPDHICLKRSFCADRDSTPGEARARYTSAVIAGGVMMLSEDFSDAEGGKRARELATVREINELVISRTAFRPTGTAEGNACRVFTASSGRTEYLAVFNPEQSDCRITVTSGLTGSELHSSYTDLWSGRKISAVHGALEISFEGCDAMILRSDS
jgi:alpha-galactosidase